MSCTIQKELGRGSNAIVYQASYPDALHPDETHTVLIKELFPFHPSCAIYRAEDGSIVHTAEGEDCWQQHRRSFVYGNRIHLRLQRRHPELTGENWNSIEKNGTLYTVLGYTGGRSLAEEMRAPETDLRRLAIRMQLLLDALGDFHAEGYLHLDIAPDNILLIGSGRNERVMLIDYNSVHAVGDQSGEAPGFSLKTGYTAPEICSGRFSDVCEASDLYSVTAVFFRCLTGAALTPTQMVRPSPPEVSGCPALRDRPEPVKAMVRQILFVGLQELPKRRCASVQAMQELLQELLDRIDGVGITHWALWEAGKQNIARTIRDNPAFAYIQEDELFPSDTVTQERAQLPTRQFIDGLLQPGGQNSFLTAPGGMGKTTALLRTVWLHTRRYSPRETAVAYVPLHAYPSGGASFITDRLLENLRFKADTQRYADARHRLRELLDRPLQTREGERPVLLLLLDGLNEVQGQTEALLKELRSLAALRGVRILLTSRAGEPPVDFAEATLAPLSEENVARQLSEKGLLLPESAEMRELLRTPLMLSLFLRSSLAEGKQLAVHSADELIAAYFRALTGKLLQDLPEDAPARWQSEAAVYFVLPAIADELQKKTRLDREDMLRIVSRCYRLFSSRVLRRAFPQWIGHSREIRGGAATAEEWYGLIVHDILWKRLGLLLYSEQDGFQLPHQILCEYLARRDRENLGRIRRRRALQLGLRSFAALLVAALCFGVYWGFIREPPPEPYDDSAVEAVLTMALCAYSDAAKQQSVMRTLINNAINNPDKYDPTAYQGNADAVLAASKEYSMHAPEEVLEAALASGTYVSWSGEALDSEAYRALMELTPDRREDYALLVPVLTELVHNRDHETENKSADTNAKYYKTYTAQLSDLLTLDAEITDRLEKLVYWPHRIEDSFEYDSYLYYYGTNMHPDLVGTKNITSSELDPDQLLQLRHDLWDAIKASPAYQAYASTSAPAG